MGTLEQLRAVDLAVVHEHVCVDVGRCRKVPLADSSSDLGPAHALVVEQADSAVAEVVRTEGRHAGIPAGATNGHAEAISRADREQRIVGVTIFPGWEVINDDREEIRRQLDPSRPSRLRYRGPD
jgi:hypothetical protein